MAIYWLFISLFQPSNCWSFILTLHQRRARKPTATKFFTPVRVVTRRVSSAMMAEMGGMCGSIASVPEAVLYEFSGVFV